MGDESDYVSSHEDYLEEIQDMELSEYPEYMTENYCYREYEDTQFGQERDTHLRLRATRSFIGADCKFTFYLPSIQCVDSDRNMLYLAVSSMKFGFGLPSTVASTLLSLGFIGYTQQNQTYVYGYRVGGRQEFQKVIDKCRTVFKSTEKEQVTLTITDRMCTVQFQQMPLPKYKKRLRDFGFSYAGMKRVWKCTRKSADFSDVLEYFRKQQNVTLQENVKKGN